jgi:hypothetical protein
LTDMLSDGIDFINTNVYFLNENILACEQLFDLS